MILEPGVVHGTLTITTNANGNVESAVITSGGSGYQYGDVLTVPLGNLGGNVGSNNCAFFVDASWIWH